jgi:hypothetical protein
MFGSDERAFPGYGDFFGIFDNLDGLAAEII